MSFAGTNALRALLCFCAASDKGKRVKKFTFTKTRDMVNHFSTSGAAVCVATATTHPLGLSKEIHLISSLIDFL